METTAARLIIFTGRHLYGGHPESPRALRERLPGEWRRAVGAAGTEGGERPSLSSSPSLPPRFFIAESPAFCSSSLLHRSGVVFIPWKSDLERRESALCCKPAVGQRSTESGGGEGAWEARDLKEAGADLYLGHSFIPTAPGPPRLALLGLAPLRHMTFPFSCLFAQCSLII